MVNRIEYAIKGIIFSFVLLFSCSNPKADEFIRFSSQLERIKTPASFVTIEFPQRMPEHKIDSALLEKYRYIYSSQPYGVIFEEKDMIGIIHLVYGDVGVPVLVTYDRVGNKIDSLNFFENASGYNEAEEVYENVTVFPDKRIRVIDTTKTWKLDSSKENRLSETPIKVRIDSFFHSVQSSGKILRRVK